MNEFILSCQRKARKAKTIIELQQICIQLQNAGHPDKASEYFTRYLIKNFGLTKPKPKQPGRAGRKGGLPQKLDYDIIRSRQQGATQFEAGESVGLSPDRPVIENHVREVEKRFSAALADPKLRREYEAALHKLRGEDKAALRKLSREFGAALLKRRREYEAALRKQHHPDLYVTRWGILTSSEIFEALNQEGREVNELIEKLNKQPPL